MRYLKLTLAYDGSDYVGWQVQPNGPSVQQVLEAAWESVTGESVRITASGRTDAGVHARGQVASLSTQSELPPKDLCNAVNAHLPGDVVLLNVSEAPTDFHAIRDAVRKHYCYYITMGPWADLFLRRYAWHVRRKLNLGAMRDAAELLKGTHDFTSFQATGSERASTVRTLFELSVQANEEGSYFPPVGDIESNRLIRIDMEADGFLYNMARNLVGTLVQVGLEKQPPSWVTDVLEAHDRDAAGSTAPAHGLFLVRVDY